MDNSTRIAVIAKPGHFRDGLAGLLNTIPGADVRAGGSDTCIQLLQTHAAPHILVMDDQSIVTSVEDFITPFRLIRPDIKCVLLVNNVSQVKEMGKYGIDCVLAKSSSVSDLLGAVEKLRTECVQHAYMAARLESNPSEQYMAIL